MLFLEVYRISLAIRGLVGRRWSVELQNPIPPREKSDRLAERFVLGPPAKILSIGYTPPHD
jgi:hypothetical protein